MNEPGQADADRNLRPACSRILKDKGIAVHDLTRPIAQRAGPLLHKAKLDSAHAVDAFVVATALAFDAAVIATADPNDMIRMAAPHRQIRVFRL